MLKRVAMAMVAALAVSAAASAQTSGSVPVGPAGQSSAQSQTAPAQTVQQPARTNRGASGRTTTTPMGDTGLWFVPTAEILPAKRWSASAYRVNFDHQQGFTDVSNWPVTFGYGLKDRVELFGSWTLVRRIDRDVRPIFRPADAHAGGLINDYPFVERRLVGQASSATCGWAASSTSCPSGQQKPMALAVRAMFKMPTAKDTDEGVGTGKMDFLFDFIASKEINQNVELSGYGGFIFRGDPRDVDLSNGFRWGIRRRFPDAQEPAGDGRTARRSAVR